MRKRTPVTRILWRAVPIVGGGDRMAKRLGVSRPVLARWLWGAIVPPINVYVVALDIVAGRPLRIGRPPLRVVQERRRASA